MDTVHYKLENGVAQITLNRPERGNALNAKLIRELSTLFVSITSDPDIRAVLLLGEGKCFCAGGDIKEMEAISESYASGYTYMEGLHPLIRALINLDVPLIAVVDGAAYGAGFSLAICADYLIATTRAKFSMSFGKVGLVPDCGAFYTLPRLVGLQRAKDLIFSARVIDAEEALALGVAASVCEPDNAMAEALAIARKFTCASPTALALAKRALNKSQESNLQTMLDTEADFQARSLQSDYHKTAVERFIAKEQPAFDWDRRN